MLDLDRGPEGFPRLPLDRSKRPPQLAYHLGDRPLIHSLFAGLAGEIGRDIFVVSGPEEHE